MQAEEAALGVERQFGMGEMIARLVVGNEALRTCADPAHRQAQPSRRPGDDAFFRVELTLVAEAAADIGRHDPQRAFGDPKLLGDCTADVVRRLRGAIERQPVGGRVDRRHRCTRLDRRADEAIVHEVDRDRMGGRPERRAHRGLVATRRAEADVARRRCMKLRRARHLRGARVGHRSKRLVVHYDPLGCIRRLQQRTGDDRDHRLTDVTNRVAGERKARRLRHGRAVARANDPERTHRRHAVGCHVGAGEHRDHAGHCHRRGRIDPPDAGMRVRRADEHTVQRAGQFDVRHEAPKPQQESSILDPSQRRTDALVIWPASGRGDHSLHLQPRHARPRAGHPRLAYMRERRRGWPGSSPAMTMRENY